MKSFRWWLILGGLLFSLPGTTLLAAEATAPQPDSPMVMSEDFLFLLILIQGVLIVLLVIALFTVLFSKKYSRTGKREAHWELLFDEIPLLIQARDRKGRLVYWNTACEQSLGFTKQELKQNPALLPQPLVQKINSSQSDFLSLDQDETTLQSFDQDILCSDESQVTVRWTPLELSQTSAPWSEYWFGRDVTSRKQTERNLQESEQRYRNLVETAAGMIWSFDERGHFRFVDADGLRKVTGREQKEVLGKSFQDFLVPEERERTLKAFQETVQGHRYIDFESSAIHADGRRIVLRSNGIPLFDEDGNSKGVFGTSTDVTELRQSQLLLSGQKQILENLATGASQEELIEAISSLVKAIFPTVETGIFLWDESKQQFLIGNAKYLSESFTRSVLLEKWRTRPHCLETEEKTPDLDEKLDWELCRKAALEAGFRNGGVLPIHGQSADPSEALGVLVVFDRVSYCLTEHEWERLQATASLAGIVMHRQRQEQALRRSEERFRLFLTYVPGAIAIFDREMTYLAVSRRWVEDYYLSEDQVLGRSHYEVFSNLPSHWSERHRRCLAGESLRGEEEYQHPDGRSDWVKWEMIPWKDLDGSIGGIAILAEKITSKKLAEDTLRERARQQSVVAELGRCGLAEQTFEEFVDEVIVRIARTLRVSHARVVLFSRNAELQLHTGVGWAAQEPLLDRETEAQAVRIVSHKGHPMFWEDLVQELKVEPIVEFSEPSIRSGIVVPIRSGGHGEGMLGIFSKERRTFTSSDANFLQSAANLLAEFLHRQRAEQKAQLAQRQLLLHQNRQKAKIQEELEKVREELVRSTRLAAVGQMSAQIAHDLRNPLGAVRNAVYLLKRRVPSTETRWVEYLEIIQEEVTICDRIISNLLEVSRGRALQLQEVDLAKMVKENCKRFEFSQHVKIQYQENNPPKRVTVDAGQILQVLDNLLKNACDAIHQEGVIRVIWDQSPERLVLSVIDNGDGISEEDRPHIFDLFYTTKAKGTGLGLVICRQIAERHGGELLLDAPNEAQETIFRLEIPLQSEHEMIPITREEPQHEKVSQEVK
ncbi:Hypothetical protein PBC10988_28630 [Planctomycetales bacterium 10988]|nr:Hypothetical protein PBC10988_28630 [Planctomycetales bacterium 10988]